MKINFEHLIVVAIKLTIPFVMALLSLRPEVGSSIARWVRNAADQREDKSQH